MTGRLTLEEIGRLTGVSRSTVSRVVNEHSDVSPEVRRRVLEVIQRTQYHPNRAARSLVSSRTGLLGLVIPSRVPNLFLDPYFGVLIQGITRAANAAAQILSLFLLDDEHDELGLYDRVVANGMVDGLVVTATTMQDPLVDRMLADGAPFVMVGRPDRDGIPYVDVDNREGARVAVAHLIAHGRHRLATVTGPSNSTTGVDRRSGFLDAAREAGIEVRPSRVVEADFTAAGAREAARQLLDDPPDGIFCASDTMARGTLQALADAGLRCPEDVAVVGFDGLLDADAITPALTTIAQPVAQTGAAAVELLLDVLDGPGDEDVPRRVLPTELVVRHSCGCPDDPPHLVDRSATDPSFEQGASR